MVPTTYLLIPILLRSLTHLASSGLFSTFTAVRVSTYTACCLPSGAVSTGSGTTTWETGPTKNLYEGIKRLRGQP